MAFRAAIGAASAYDQIKHIMASTKDACTTYRVQFAASGASGSDLISLLNYLHTQYTRLAELDQAPGIAEEAKRDSNDPSYDVVPEYTAARAAIKDARDGIKAAVPLNSGRPDLQDWSTDGFSTKPRQFTPAQAATILPLLQAVEDAITTDFVTPA